MQKILFAIPDMGSGGAERVISILAKEYIKANIEVEILMFFGRRIHYDLSKEIKIHSLNLLNYSTTKRILILRNKLKEIRGNNNCMIAIYAFHESVAKYSIASRIGLKNIKIISSERNNPYIKGNSFWSRLRASIPYLLSNHVVFQTPQARAYYNLIPNSKCTVIPNPITTSQYRWQGNITQHKLISVCRLHSQKNIPMSLKVVEVLRNKFPDIHLDIYGEGSLKETIEHQINELNLEHHVSLKGTTHEVSKVLSEASIYISTSDFEGISNSMLEAMSVGMPVVCTNCPIGGAYLMLNDNAGLLSPVQDANAFAQQVTRVLSNQNLAKFLAQNSFNKSKEFTPSKIAESWLSIVSD